MKRSRKRYERPRPEIARRCIIEATIEPLMPCRRRGFGRSNAGPFFCNSIVMAMVNSGELRMFKESNGRRRILVSARAA